MKKNDVYKLIGYNGEYNASVKKAIRKLLKENHPDNRGDRTVFELVNEVKKELENGNVSYKKDVSKSKNNNIDYDYYYKKIDELKVKRNTFNEMIDSKKKVLLDYEKEYKNLYQNNLDLENNLLINTPLANKVNNTRILNIIFLLLIIIVFALAVLKNNNILFIAFVIISIVYILIIQKNLLLVHKMAEKNKKYLNNYVKLNNDIKKNLKKQDIVKKEIREIKRKVVNIENDLRFYKNLLK